MVMAVRGEPVMFTGVSPINRSNSLPVSTLGRPGLVTAHTGVRQRPKPPRMPPAAKPFTNVRLEVLECMPFISNQSKGKPCETTDHELPDQLATVTKTNSYGKRVLRNCHI